MADGISLNSNLAGVNARVATERTSQRAFFVISTLLFATGAAVTIVCCASMSAMGGMPMPGGWRMSMVWMRMPGQTWPGAAASFLGMWTAMMLAMMLPCLVPLLWRYRQAVCRTGETRLGWLTALVGAGYFFRVDRDWIGRVSTGRLGGGSRDAAPGTIARSADRGGYGRSDRRRASVHAVEGPSPCLLPEGTGARPDGVGQRRYGLATRAAPGGSLQLLLCHSN